MYKLQDFLYYGIYMVFLYEKKVYGVLCEKFFNGVIIIVRKMFSVFLWDFLK